MEARERQGKRAGGAGGGGRERELEEENKRKKGVRLPSYNWSR